MEWRWPSAATSLNRARHADAGLSIVLPMIYLVTGGIGLPGGAVYIDRGAIRSRYGPRWPQLETKDR